MIPKVIHQIWLGSKVMPGKWKESWLLRNPGFSYIIWKAPIEGMKTINQFKKYYDRKIYHGAADILRYEILFRYGGFVAPADSECLMSIEPLLSDSDCFCCYENEQVRPGLISPHFGCVPNHPLMEELIDRLSRTQTIGEPWKKTGNAFVTEVINETDYNVEIYPSYFFIPEHYTGIKTSVKYPIFARHHWGTTKNLYTKQRGKNGTT